MIDDEPVDVDVTEPELPGNSSGKDKLVFSVATRNAFFNRVSTQLAKRLPPQYAEFKARPMFNLMKIAYANDRVHYEVAIDNARRLLEVALHFEDGPVSTLAYLNFFDQRIIELKHLMGHQIELERWTVSWGRLYELWPLESLDRPVADRVAARLCDYISTLQPLLDTCGIPPERSAQPPGPRRERWRRAASR